MISLKSYNKNKRHEIFPIGSRIRYKLPRNFELKIFYNEMDATRLTKRVGLLYERKNKLKLAFIVHNNIKIVSQ